MSSLAPTVLTFRRAGKSREELISRFDRLLEHGYIWRPTQGPNSRKVRCSRCNDAVPKCAGVPIIEAMADGYRASNRWLCEACGPTVAGKLS